MKLLGTSIPAVALKNLFAVAPSAQASLFDHGGAEYRRIEPGVFHMGGHQDIPLAMCEPLAYMTRSELQTMFSHGDPARFVLSDSLFLSGDADERPTAAITLSSPFYLSATQVTNRQFERFDPSHRKLRGKFGFSKEDNEAVVYVSWHEAEAYCKWLAEQEGKPYRLPTEAEWEYAARAGTQTLFSTGDKLPAVYLKNAQVTDFSKDSDKVRLRVGQTPPNPWGLFDMHGNVEEWVQDWYVPYAAENERHIGGPAQGDFKITRGGSHGTFAYYLRSANRSAALPDTRGFTIGFRVAMGEVQSQNKNTNMPAEIYRQEVNTRKPADFMRGPDSSTLYFRGPIPFVKIAADAKGPLFHYHNHDTSLTECPNGDLLAIWYSCAKEQGRELSIAASRLPFGSEEWGEAYSFWETPDRNDHCPAIWFDGEDTLYHLNGVALSHYWEPLAIIMRTSKNSGATWSRARYIVPEFGFSNMVCQPILRLRNGYWLFGADAHPENSAVWISKDEGKTWEDPGGRINGIHAAIVELTDGRLMALGRGNNIDHHMPMSISDDYGKTWTAQATELPPITFTQRFAMTRLKEGPIALATFVPDINTLGPQAKTDRELAKLCIAISYDEGKTWPVRRLLSDTKRDHGVAGISNARIYMGPGTAEPTGYVSICQSRNGVINVISSANHYAFNLAWVKAAPVHPDPMPKSEVLPLRTQLSSSLNEREREALRISLSEWTNERTGAFDALDLKKGFTVEGRFTLGNSTDATIQMRAFVRNGATMCNRYWLRVNQKSVSYWHAGEWQLVNDNVARSATYRMAVRADTCVQIYSENVLIGTYPPSYEIGFAMPTRGSFLEWSIFGDGSDTKVENIAYDLEGPFQKQ